MCRTFNREWWRRLALCVALGAFAVAGGCDEDAFPARDGSAADRSNIAPQQRMPRRTVSVPKRLPAPAVDIPDYLAATPVAESTALAGMVPTTDTLEGGVPPPPAEEPRPVAPVATPDPLDFSQTQPKRRVSPDIVPNAVAGE